MRARVDATLGPIALSVRDLSVAHLAPVSLSVCSGEIVGLAGLVGAGRSELLETIAGLRLPTSGTVDSVAPPVLLPEDRGLKGLVSTLTVRENLFLPPASWRVGGRQEREDARRWVEKLRIRCSGTEAAPDSLSGGNQQKLLLARALRHRSAVLLLDEPTAGVDVGAKAEIHDIICQQADDGAAVLLASSELPELLHLCDRGVDPGSGSVLGANEVGLEVSPRERPLGRPDGSRQPLAAPETTSRADASEARVGALITGGE
jgi:ABC-type sugar transport system ATPase subunit